MKTLFGMLLVLFVVSPAFADTVTTNIATLIFPNDVVITSDQTIPSGISLFPESDEITFSFADGTGNAEGNLFEGDGGVLDFTTPVTSLTINWLISGSSDGLDSLTDFIAGSEDRSGNTISYFDCGPFCPDTGTVTFTGDISSLEWAAPTGGLGWGGIESMSYVLSTPVCTPEPGTIVLLIAGLVALGALSYRRQSSDRGVGA